MKIIKEKNTTFDVDGIKEFIEKYAMLNRVAVCDETNEVAEEVAQKLGGEIISIPSGTECLTWIIPKRWQVKEAYIETMDGKKIVEFKDNPLHLFSYSIPFDGILTKEELENHLFYDKENPKNIPYHYSYQYAFGQEGWGFCLSYDEYKQMNDEKYRVFIDSDIDDGVMKITDYYIKGESEETILIAAHNCHPGLVNDGLSSVAIALELFKYLKTKKNRYSYRLVIGPEFYAAAGFLARAQDVDKIKYGIYLDMLGNNEHMGLSHSFKQDTYIDKVMNKTISVHDKGFVSASYRGLSGNDEFFYDGPDFYIPMVCLGRYDYSEYHLDSDNIENCDFVGLERHFNFLKDVIRVLETDFVPVRQYKGPLYLSRYGISKNTKANVSQAIALDKIQILMDGRHSCLEIADKLDVEYDFVYGFTKKLFEKDLVKKI